MIPIFTPFLMPEDLGIDLEEDSPDLTEDEVLAFVDTEDRKDFIKQVLPLLQIGGTSCELRRKGGILYCRVKVGERSTLFKIEWLRKP